MTGWSDLAARLVALGWRREGRAMRGPCPVTGAGRRGAWFEPGRTAAVVGGCHKCDESFEAHLSAVRGEPARDVAPHHATHARPASPPSDLSARLWRAAAAPEQTPGARYLEQRGVWPAGDRLPASVRWLPGDVARRVGVSPPLPTGAAGCVVYRFGSPGEANTCAAQLEAVDTDGVRVTFLPVAAGRRPSEATERARVHLRRRPARVSRGRRSGPGDSRGRGTARRAGARAPGTARPGGAAWRRGAWHERRGAVPAGGVSGPWAGDGVGSERSGTSRPTRGGDAAAGTPARRAGRDDPASPARIQRLGRMGASGGRGTERNARQSNMSSEQEIALNYFMLHTTPPEPAALARRPDTAGRRAVAHADHP